MNSRKKPNETMDFSILLGSQDFKTIKQMEDDAKFSQLDLNSQDYVNIKRMENAASNINKMKSQKKTHENMDFSILLGSQDFKTIKQMEDDAKFSQLDLNSQDYANIKSMENAASNLNSNISSKNVTKNTVSTVKSSLKRKFSEIKLFVSQTQSTLKDKLFSPPSPIILAPASPELFSPLANDTFAFPSEPVLSSPVTSSLSVIILMVSGIFMEEFQPIFAMYIKSVSMG